MTLRFSSRRRVRKTSVFENTFGNTKSRRQCAKFAAFLFKKMRAPFCGHYSVLIYSMRSDGWQSSTSQILSSASTGRCLTVLVQIADIVGGRMPVLSANSFCVISRTASITLTLNFIRAEAPLENDALAYYNTLFVFCQYGIRKIITIFIKKLRKTYWQITIFVV